MAQIKSAGMLAGTASENETNTTFEVLAHPVRRRLLLSLAEDEHEPVSIQLTSRETGFTDDEIATLYHCHLPKLVQDQLVDWDHATHTLTPGPRFDTARTLLELLVDNDD